jgi:hypothetical protein
MPAPGERVLAAELLAGYTIQWINAASKSGTAPAAAEGFGLLVGYGALAAVAMLGEQAAKLAAGLGGLILLAIVAKAGGSALSAVAPGATPGAAAPAGGGGSPASGFRAS